MIDAPCVTLRGMYNASPAIISTSCSGSPSISMFPTGITWTGRVAVSYVLGTKGGRVTDV